VAVGVGVEIGNEAMIDERSNLKEGNIILDKGDEGWSEYNYTRRRNPGAGGKSSDEGEGNQRLKSCLSF
jgi:hypothetical protein